MNTTIRTISLLGLLLLLASCAERVDTIHNAEETALRVISISQTPGWAQGVWVVGNTAYIADGEQWVGVWDITVKESPVQIDTVEVLRAVTGVYYSPNTDLLMVDMPFAQGGITLYDLSDERRIITVFDAGLEGWGFREISTDTIIVAEIDRSEGFKVFAIGYDSEFNEWSVIAGMRPVHIFESASGSGRGLHYENEFAYIARNQAGVTIIEVNVSSFSVDLTELGTVDTPGGARDVALNAAKTHAIVADYQAGISIIDITDKSNPSYITSLLPDGVDQMSLIYAVGDTVYTIDNNNGIFVFDVTIPSDPKFIARYDSPKPRGIFVSADHTIYLADEDIGLIILGWRD